MKKKIKAQFLWVFWIIYLEFIYRIFVVGSFFDKNTLIVILFSIPWIIILSIFLNMFNSKINKFLNAFFLVLITIITLAQIVYYNFYDSIFSFFSFTTGTGQVMQFWEIILDIIFGVWYIFLITLIPVILYLIFNSKLFEYKKMSMKRFVINICIFVLSFVGIILVIKYDNKSIYSTKRLLFETHAPMLTINKTGLLTMEAIDIWRYTFGFEEKIIIDNDPIIEIEEEKIIEYNVYNIDFDELINNTDKEKVIKMHKYFQSVEPTEKNEYTGIFKDKNLIFITAEGFDAIAVDENITPTLYKMANNSYIFTNYYQPLYPVSTSDGEYMALVGLIPKEGVWSFERTAKISMPLGFGKMFKKEGYTSYGFHNHTSTYYSRDISHKNIGLNFIACGNGLEKKMNCKKWPNSDKEMIEATTSYYINKDEPFATYYMTVSGHLNYNFYGNNMASRNKKLVENLKYSTAVKAYYATQIEFDKAMALLLQELETAGKLDDTLIVITPDHYPYGLTFKQLNEVSKLDRSNKFENYHTTLIMYNSKLENQVIDKVVSSIDILPTIYNLYGLEFDSRLLMGRDIFSDSEGLAILYDRSWITAKGKYNSVNKTFTKTTDEEVDEEYIKNINKIVNQKFSMSSLILDTNYYKELGI